MTFKKTLAAALAATTMLATAGAAFAAPGVTTGAVNFREAPTTASDVIDTLSKGTLLEIEGCGDGWCAVEYDDEEGYVSASYLALIGDDDDEDYDDDDDHDEPDVDVELCLGGGGWGGPGFGYGSICIDG